eukprot:COSAG02_NODE_23494_length_717_cov_0.776699_1_plen_197_part_00
MSFEPELVSQFVEYSETPLKAIKQTGPPKTPTQPVRDIVWHAEGKEKATLPLPLMHIVPAPGCGESNRLKSSVNRGTAVRSVLSKINVVYLNGPGGMPWTDKWQELGHEGYIPQVYFYSRQGLPLHVINEGKDEWNWHSFTNEGALLKGIQEAISRDKQIADGASYESVARLPGQSPASPPPTPLPSAGSPDGMNK